MPGLTRSLFAGIGPALARYAIELEKGSLCEVARLQLPGRVQGAAFSADGRFMYVGYGSATDPVQELRTVALCEPGAPLVFAGPPVKLPARAIKAVIHPDGKHLLVCLVEPAMLTVHCLGPEGEVGEPILQERELDFGVFGHDVVFMAGEPPLIVMAARGHDAQSAKPEIPGSLRMFHLDGGQLHPLSAVVPDGGYGFGPRNIAFHPTGKHVYVSLERQNSLQSFPVRDGRVQCERTNAGTTLSRPHDIKPRQYTGCVDVHPRGNYVYVINRAEGTVEIGGEKLFNGGDNTMAVYAVDADGANPRLVQHADTGCIHPRSFHVDSDGRHLVVASLKARNVRDEHGLRVIEAGFAVLSIADDGRLDFLRKHPIEIGREMIFWMDMPLQVPAILVTKPSKELANVQPP